MAKVGKPWSVRWGHMVCVCVYGLCPHGSPHRVGTAKALETGETRSSGPFGFSCPSFINCYILWGIWCRKSGQGQEVHQEDKILVKSCIYKTVWEKSVWGREYSCKGGQQGVPLAYSQNQRSQGSCSGMKGKEMVGEEVGKVAGGQLLQGYGS